eukprot:1904-Heterococcus_DN1.PRE.10
MAQYTPQHSSMRRKRLSHQAAGSTQAALSIRWPIGHADHRHETCSTATSTVPSSGWTRATQCLWCCVVVFREVIDQSAQLAAHCQAIVRTKSAQVSQNGGCKYTIGQCRAVFSIASAYNRALLQCVTTADNLAHSAPLRHVVNGLRRERV